MIYLAFSSNKKIGITVFPKVLLHLVLLLVILKLINTKSITKSMAVSIPIKVLQIKCRDEKTVRKWKEFVEKLKRTYPREIRNYEDALNYVLNRIEKEFNEISFV